MQHRLWLIIVSLTFAISQVSVVGLAMGESVPPKSQIPSAPAPASTPPTYIMASVPNGIIAVSQSSGDITYCNNPTLGTASGDLLPEGMCIQIGKITPASSSVNSLSVTSSGLSAFVMNNLTGQVLQCTGTYTVGSNQPRGSCKLLGNLAK